MIVQQPNVPRQNNTFSSILAHCAKVLPNELRRQRLNTKIVIPKTKTAMALKSNISFLKLYICMRSLNERAAGK